MPEKYPNTVLSLTFAASCSAISTTLQEFLSFVLLKPLPNNRIIVDGFIVIFPSAYQYPNTCTFISFETQLSVLLQCKRHEVSC